MTTPTTTGPPRRTQLVQQNVEMLSLPTRDSPAYYDSTSSAGSDSDLSDFAAAELDDHPLDHLAVPSSAHPVPTTNRGHKLSRLAPHTRRGKLGHYPNADAGFAQDAPGTAAGGGDLSAGATAPAQKRRKLNDVAPYASEAGFPVAPNLHLVPRPVHSLSRESDHPATAYLPPVPQSPLDLLLMPSVQHTLGKKNQTFHLLGASATALIEQEAELINALAKVCRDLRGEGFEWRWQGDEGRRLAKQAAKDEEERNEVAKEAETAAAAAAAEANEPIAAIPAVTATPADTQATPAPPEAAAAATALETPSETPAATNAVIADLKNGDDDVKLEQATPVLQSAVAPASTLTLTEQQVVVPGVTSAGQEEAATAAAEEDTEMRSAEEGVASAEATPNPSSAAATANTTEPALASAVTAAALAQGTDSGAGGSAPPPSAKEIAEEGKGGAAKEAEGARASAPPATTTATTTTQTGGGEVPAIAVTGPGSTTVAADGVPAEGAIPAAAAAVVAPAASVKSTAGAGAGAGGAAEAAAAAEGDETATAGEATPAPSTAGGDEAASTGGGGGLSASNAAAAAARRRSGRVPAAAAGGGGRGGGGSVRHTRSRQSSPEDEGLYTSAGEDDALLYDDEAAAELTGAGGGRRRGGGGAGGGGSASGSMTTGAGARAPLVPEEELPEYAKRMIDPEGYVRSLFVTEDKVELERLVPAPTGGMVGTGQFDSLTPNEQEVLLHDCMTDLHRFLADALEYRNRLSEIRDGILGVERRRKGMWKVVRTVANDFLAEEEGAVYGQQQQQQQQDGGAGYD
ncbi:hypothetical protein B0A53_04345 [Rhodotorula sp. CCFEE 5036]|nr:hypothetical protein B0A53_04345 [Rhodotorula sp. CCFEE 5036]